MSRPRSPHGPLQPFVFRLSDAERLALEAEARRQGTTVAVLVRDIVRWYLTQVRATVPTNPEVPAR